MLQGQKNECCNIEIEDDRVLVAQEDYLERITWMTVPNFFFFFFSENEM